MSWRKWLVRGLVFAIAGGLVLTGWMYRRWTNPSAVRLQVIQRLNTYFVGAQVNVDAAHLRLLGGISVTDVRLSRRDDPDRVDFAHIPSGVIYHDKEQLLHGKLAIRKLELFRPRLRVIRGPDGRWNLAGVLELLPPREPIPTIVVHQGTILLEDRCPGGPGRSVGETDQPVRIELRDVSLSIVNDPLPTLNFQARGQAELSGAVHLRGTWRRDSHALAVTFEAPALPVRPALTHRLAAYVPCLGEHAQYLEGIAKLRLDLTYQPGAAQPWSSDLHCHLTEGKFHHPLAPLPLERLQVRLRYLDDQVTLDECTAESGTARLQLTGTARFALGGCGTDGDCSGSLKLEHLPLTPAFFARLPDQLQSVQTEFSPTGTVNLAVDFARRDGHWTRHCVLRPEELSICFVRFPYRLDRLQGQVEHKVNEAEGTETLNLDLIGHAGDRPVYIKGQVKGAKPVPSVYLDVWSDGVPLDEKLEMALPARFQLLARSFHPTGKADFVALIRRPSGVREFSNRLVIRFHEASCRYEVFPYPLENVSGILDIQPGHWEFRDFKGTHKGGEVRGKGRSIPTTGGDRVAIEVSGSNLLLDHELEEALQPTLRKAWKAFQPGGRMSFHATIDNLPGQPRDIDVTVNVQGCTLRPAFLPYPLDRVTGTVRYAQDRVILGPFRAGHGGSVFGLEKGEVFLKPGGGFYAKLDGLSASPLVPDADLLQALPTALRKAAAALQLRDPVHLRTQLIVDMPSEAGSLPSVYWDGSMELREARLIAGVPLEQVTGKIGCRGLHDGRQLQGLLGNVLLDHATAFKLPFRNIHCHIDVPREAPQVLRLPDIKARLFDGDVGGSARIEFGPSLRYDVNLTALQVKLEEFGKHNLGNAQLSGQLMARLYLSGRGTDINGLEGRGTIDVPNGQMYNLPLLLDLLKVLGLRPPDRTAFEEAHASFEIAGPRVHVRRLELYGSAISLSGQGEMNLDGSDLQLDFYAVWGRLVQWLPPVLKEIPPTIGQFLLKVKMRGKVGDVQFTKEPVPVLVEPVEKLLRRLGNGNGGAARTPLFGETVRRY